MLVNLDGSVQNREERLNSMKSGDTKFDSFAYDEINVRSNPEGTGAVAIARATATGTNKGRKIEGSDSSDAGLAKDEGWLATGEWSRHADRGCRLVPGSGQHCGEQ